MISAFFGLAAALSLGAADFMARFSSRALGAMLTYAYVLLIGAIGTTVWLFATDQVLVWSPLGVAIAVLHGVSVVVMCVLLYIGIARGPIAVGAPIVAAHPAPVLAVNVLMGMHPSAMQWAAMTIVIAGGVIIARSSKAGKGAGAAAANRTTLLIALAACLAYVAIVLTAQSATPLIGAFQTMWIGRVAGLVLLGGVLIVQRARLAVPREWVPFVGLQGGLDSLGYLTFLAGSNSAAPYVTMVIASAFSVVTVVLARLFLHEPISKMQWVAIALIAVGAAVLTAS
jgi:drug/metabolite transporter (DMT)-like permease